VELKNSFVVAAAVDQVWETLLDIERVAPCMPGATLLSVDGDDITGSVKVKLGPVSMTYKGQATFQEKDPVAHVAVIEGTGRETRGTGTAKALVHTSLHSESAERTRVEVVTDLTITGKAAQFGRGVMQDVAGRLIDQFADNLAAMMAGVPAVPDAPPEQAQEATGATEPSEATEQVPAARPPVPDLPHNADAIDLLGTAGAPVAKRVLPVLVAVVVVTFVVWRLRRRR
jgi:carbon monoxide dehydrogenase subunit G